MKEPQLFSAFPVVDRDEALYPVNSSSSDRQNGESRTIDLGLGFCEEWPMQITVTTPALLFPAISLFMLAFTNRFLSLGGRVRSLHDQYRSEGHESIRKQIENLRIRIHMIRRMQGFAVISMLSCIFSMVCLFQDWILAGQILFGASLLFLAISLVLSFMEIRISVRALDILLEDMEKDAPA